jgi:putative nucleotidyltransferase with HDIG domain
MAPITPPRFVIRTLVATLATVAFVLSAVLLVVTLNVRTNVRSGVVDRLDRVHSLLAALEERRAQELRAQVAMLAENSTLKAAVDTYQSELRTTNPTGRQDLVATIARELDKLAARIQPDVLEVRSVSGEVLGVAGRRAEEWSAYARGTAPHQGTEAAFVTTPSGIFRLASVPVVLQGTELGTLSLASALDERYAREISDLSGAQTLILSDDHVLATTLPGETLGDFKPEVIHAMGSQDVVTIGGSEYAVRRLLNVSSGQRNVLPTVDRRAEHEGAQVYVLDSIDASARPAIEGALRTMGWIALGAFVLAALASVWLSRTIARPIDTLSAALTSMTESRNFENPLTPGGDILEVDALTLTFNTMIQSVKAAEDERLSAYLGTIRALALALDARDPYTAGHSERVSALSLAIGRCLWLDDAQLEVLRLGALLHDIGKIGISDHVLMKPGPLSAEEYEIIKQHPAVGARILRSVPFLEPHIPIVELHHERPDGKGYPHGLRGTEIPLVASIVHVADAFDAITSARAYRPARASAEGLRELWRCAGAQFDAEVVHALAKALPDLDRAPAPADAFPRITALPVPLQVRRA